MKKTKFTEEQIAFALRQSARVAFGKKQSAFALEDAFGNAADTRGDHGKPHGLSFLQDEPLSLHSDFLPGHSNAWQDENVRLLEQLDDVLAQLSSMEVDPVCNPEGFCELLEGAPFRSTADDVVADIAVESGDCLKRDMDAFAFNQTPDREESQFLVGLESAFREREVVQFESNRN